MPEDLIGIAPRIRQYLGKLGLSLGVIDDKIDVVDGKIGEDTDFWNGERTLLGYSNTSYQHVHQPALCFPSLENGITINTSTTTWELGAFTELIPTNAIDDAFDIHWINFENASATGVYELHLYAGEFGQEIEIARIRTSREGAQTGTTNVPVQIPVQHANTRISAKLASNGSNRNVTVSVFYHGYI